MWGPESLKTKILLLVGTITFTVAFHYGWLVEPIFGHVHWVHAIHGRFCYIPIAIAASWFGLRGGLFTATTITVLVLPYILLNAQGASDFAGEAAEIVFYFALAILIGVLVEREYKARRSQQEAQLQVERSHKLSLVGQLAAGVAHEIKNPLASIKGAADVLAEDDTSASDRAEFKNILRNEIKRIDDTVAEYLEFSRPKQTFRRRINLTTTLRSTLRQVEGQANQQHIRINSDLQEDIMVDGDAEKLHQIALNLVLNAIEASPSGGLIDISLNARGAREVQITITDRGAGIKEADLERVFEPFFTTRSSGTGLGLAVAKDIVEAHDGRISIRSREGQGTTVTVSLPRLGLKEHDENTAGR